MFSSKNNKGPKETDAEKKAKKEAKIK